jgi:predicted kinase
MFTLKSFYRSDEWNDFRKIIIAERTKDDGFIYDEVTGKPIVKQYDIILHHKIELTDDNVNDVSVSLNPDNIMVVSFRTHNELHKRFGYQGKIIKQVFLVWGAPCAGKSTWVDSVAEKDDLVVDLDRIWCAVRATSCGLYDKPDALKSVVFDIRDKLYEDVRTRRGKWQNAYIIGGYPLEAERERLADMIGADKLVFIDTSEDVCLLRAKEKSSEWSDYVRQWFDRYTPPSA